MTPYDSSSSTAMSLEKQVMTHPLIITLSHDQPYHHNNTPSHHNIPYHHNNTPSHHNTPYHHDTLRLLVLDGNVIGKAGHDTSFHIL